MKNQHPGVMNGFPPARASQVTFANYTITPFNTWGFRQMDSVAHTAMLPRGGPLPANEVAIDPYLAKRVIADAEGHERTLDDLLETHDADGFMVLRDGKIVYENYWNGFTAHQRHIWYSMTKSLVSTAFGILV
jgi:CubicO group peptidase (beta-lactamase class C family)